MMDIDSLADGLEGSPDGSFKKK